MNKFFFEKLAWTNIKKNYRTYVPYILTCIGTVMMFYMIAFLGLDDSLSSMKYGQQMVLIMRLGIGVVAIFSVIFLFYTNSFLVKRRKKEFGLYNILGLEKKHISRMLFCEVIYVAVISLTAGILLGIILSKAIILFINKIMGITSAIDFSVSIIGIIVTIILFGIIFLLILIKDFRQIQVASPMELLRAGQAGEKEPKANWIIAIAGLVFLGAGYAICIVIKNPVNAILGFFGAVILIILGTYCLFTAGSIALLKTLKKNKKFYYQTKHFVSVSGMIYRMKQNAVGLGNICILSTMVIVMISTTVTLNHGIDDTLRIYNPRNVSAQVFDIKDNQDKDIVNCINDTVADSKVEKQNMLYYKYGTIYATKNGNSFENSISRDNSCTILALTLDDYNRITGKNEQLENNEVIVCNQKDKLDENTLVLGDNEYKVTKTVDKFTELLNTGGQLETIYYLIVKDEAAYKNMAAGFMGIGDEEGSTDDIYMNFYCGFDTVRNTDIQKKLENSVYENLTQKMSDASIITSSEGTNRDEYKAVYGGLLFLGIFLGILFTMAMVLIMYYKQISEGHDDRERFQIMQKVGMSHKEVKTSIRSQVLTVFFLPLGMAVVHVAVAFILIKKLMIIMGLVSMSTFIICTVITVLIFGIVYGMIYMITARSYYKIVG